MADFLSDADVGLGHSNLLSDADLGLQSAPVTVGGLAKQLPIGGAEGAIDIAGGIPDINSGLQGLANKYVADPLLHAIFGPPPAKTPATTAPNLNDYLGSEAIQSGVEKLTGKFPEAQNGPEQYIRNIGRFLPAAIGGPEGIAARVAKQAVVPGLASEAAGQATQGTALEPYARLGAAIAAPVAAGGAAAALPSRAAKTTIDEVKAAANAGYQDPAITAVQLKPQAVSNLADSISGDLKRQRINDRLAPQTHALLDDLKTPVNGPAHTIEDLETTRQRLGDLAGNFNNPTEQKAATTAIKALDTYSGNIPQSHLLAGDAKAANSALTEARANYASAKTAEKVQEKLNNADLRAASTYSGGNLNNATRQNLRSLLTSKTGQRGLTPDELQTIEDTVRGSTVGNVARAAGKILGGGGGLGMLASGAAGHALAGPAGLAAPILGYGLKKAGDAITRAKSQRIVNQILTRSPVGAAKAQQAQEAAALALPDSLATLRRMLLANAATLPSRLVVNQSQ